MLNQGASAVDNHARQGPQSARQPEKPRLPQLHGIVNRRAQQIIMDHMHNSATQSSFSSTATVPVLMQIEHTAPRTARTHDISHLRDQSAYLTPTIPPSLIEEADHIYETGFLPKDASSTYHEQDGLWHTKVFPSNTPSSRTDAVMLDAWITKSLDAYKKMGAGGGKEDLARAVEDLVPILSIALHEIVRQVTHHCIERGTVLEKIWRTYVELFDRVLHEMQVALRKEKKKTTEVHDVLTETRVELEGLQNSHPEQMQDVIAQMEAQFTSSQKKVEEDLLECETENHRLKQELRTCHTELEMWYPSFFFYQDSYIKHYIPQFSRRGGHGRAGQAAEEEEPAAEVAIAEDFKRLLAVLAPEKRQAIGKELTFVLKTAAITTKPEKDNKHGKDGKHGKTRLSLRTEDDQKTREDEAKLQSLHDEVTKQELQIQDLKETIKELERQQLADNRLALVSGVEEGQDGDGLVLEQRRATAAPAALDDAALGGRHGNRLKLPP